MDKVNFELAYLCPSLSSLNWKCSDLVQKGKYVLKCLESIVRKGKNAGNEYFFFSHNVFKVLISMGCLNSGLCCQEVKSRL